MDDKSWIKLYRKVLLNGILRDHTAWALFTWMLLTCNRKGEVIVSRFTTSRALSMNPSTFRHALERLEQKHQTVAISKTNKFSVVRIVNWAKYQNTEELEASPKAITRPSEGQQKATYTRIENRERRINTIANKLRCPLTEKGNEELKAQYPKGHQECTEFIDSVASSKGHKFVNYPKQLRFVHQCLRSGFTFDDMDKAIGKIEKDKFYVEKGWDFANVASHLERK